MSLTAEQLALRQHSIGGSDVSAILGVNPYRNSYDVWARLTDKIDKQEEAGEAAITGNLLEPILLDWAEREIGAGPIARNETVIGDFRFPCHAQLDGRVIATGRTVEGKTTGLEGPVFGAWGAPDTDQVPEWVLTQCTHQMRLAKVTDYCHVPAWIGGRGKVMFRVAFSSQLSDLIIDALSDFYEKHVKTDTPPVNVQPSLDLVKRFRRLPGKTVPATDEIQNMAEEVMAIRAKASEVEKAKKNAEARLIAALGDAEGTDDGRVTYLLQKRAGYVVQDSEYRVLRAK